MDNYSDWLGEPPIIALFGDDQDSTEYQLGTREYDWHQHIRGQLFCVESGLLHIETEQGSWLLPPNHAGWIPAQTEHKVHVSGAMRGWTLFIQAKYCERLSPVPCVINISQVLNALVQRATQWEIDVPLCPQQHRIAQVILDEVLHAPHAALHIPMPKHPRLSRIAQTMLQNPTNDFTVEQWADYAAMSTRNLRRLFRSETGLSFSQWRQQVRLMFSLDQLAQGIAVNQISEALGYATPSNFIMMFRKTFGDSPAHYFAAKQEKFS